MKIRFIALLCLLTAQARAADFSSAFAIVMIDDATESSIGPFPYDRSVMAKAVDACAQAGAKAVVLKFFFDQPRSADGDTALAESMKNIPVVLQARLEPTEGTATDIPAGFRFGNERVPVIASGARGWIPLPILLNTASDLGFVDFTGPRIPLVEEYRDTPYKSLIVCCLELATSTTAKLESGRAITLGDSHLPLDRHNAFTGDLSKLEPFPVISFSRLLEGKVGTDDLAGRVVIIGLDSSRSPTLPTEHGRMRIHRLFLHYLAACHRKITPTKEPIDFSDPLFPPAR